MTDQVFYRKWRPQAFSEVVGQEHVTTTLLNALASERVAHAYLFCGPRGTGKTSMGRILAKAVNCLRNGKGEPCNDCTMCADIAQGRALDLIEIDAASNRGIDEIRSLREKVGFAPNTARRKVYIIDEVHMLTAPAFNALLKTLEEPPPHTVIVLATTESHKLPATIISRCQRFDLRRISRNDVVRRLAQVCESEGAQATDAALGLVARSAGGSLRDAENILEQLVVGVGGTIDEEAVRAALGIGGREQMRALAHAALERDLGKGLAALEEVAGEGFDLAQFHRELLTYLRGLMLLKAEAASVDDLSTEEQEEAKPLLASAGLDRIVAVLRAFGTADLKDAAALTLPLELALLETVTGPQVPAAPAPQERAAPQQPQPSRPAPRAAAPAAAAPSPRERRPPPAQRPPPPARAPAPQPAPTADPGSDGGRLAALEQRWRDVVAASKGTGRIRIDAVLRSGSKPLSVEDGVVVIGFTHQKFVDMLKEELDNPASRKALEDAVAGVVGSRHTVQCVLQSQPPKSAGGHLVRAAQEAGARLVDASATPGPKAEGEQAPHDE